MRRRPLALLVLLLAVTTSACRLSLASDIRVADDGSGTFTFAVAVDDELDALLADAGVDLTLGLDEARDAAPAWTVEERDLDDGRELTFRTEFADPAALTDLVEDLHGGLGPDDPAVLRDVSLTVDADGRVGFRADAGLELPTTTGAEGDGVVFDGDDLAALIEREGERVARYDLRLELPGDPEAHDADVRDGRVLTWSLPVGTMRSVSADSAPPADREILVLAGIFLGAALLSALVVVVVRRRR